MANNTGYDFYIDGLVLPFAPPSLKIRVGNRNDTVTLINQGEINILKSPSLIEVEFEARIPQQQYPFAKELKPVKTYTDKLKDLKGNQRPFQFLVTRTSPNGNVLFDTDIKMTVEEYEVREDAQEGFDVLIEIKLKQYKEYGTQTAKIESKVTTENDRGGSKSVENAKYTVKSGDCLWNIAKAYYGDGSRWKEIYEANKDVIEARAAKSSKGSSSNGHWIFPGTELVIPGVNNTSATTVSKGSGSSSKKNPPKEDAYKYTDYGLGDEVIVKANTTVNAATENIGFGGGSTSGSGGGRPTNHKTPKAKVSIGCNGINAYAGTITIYGFKNGAWTHYTSEVGKGVSEWVDENSTVEVVLSPSAGGSFIVSAMSGNWKGSGKKYSAKATGSCGFTVKWVR